MLIKVSVQNLKLFVPVGWYPEEIKMLTEIDVSLFVTYQVDHHLKDDLIQTIDYSELHRILKSTSEKSFKLLESFGQEILKQITSRFSTFNIKEMKVMIQKSQILESGSIGSNQFIEITT